MKHRFIFLCQQLRIAANLSLSCVFGKAVLLVAVLAVFWAGLPAQIEAAERQSRGDRTLTVEALSYVAKGQWDKARDATARADDPLADKVLEWSILMATKTPAGEDDVFRRIQAFMTKNPDWPYRKTLRLKAEGALPQDIPPADVVAWFEEMPPQTPMGMSRYMNALLAVGHQDKARDFFSQWWVHSTLSREQQKRVFTRYRAYLTDDAHQRRLDVLIQNGYTSNARAVAAVLGGGYPHLVAARMALRTGRGNVDALVAAVPPALQDDAGLLLDRLTWRRKKGFTAAAVEILDRQPEPKAGDDVSPWWAERHIIIRRYLEAGDYKTAYRLAMDHKQYEGFSYAQAEWLAGWLALRFMDNPTGAYERFEAFYARVKTPISKSRGAYWAAQAAYDIGQTALAENWFRIAAAYKTTFYGQLAGKAIGEKSLRVGGDLPRLSRADKAAYQADDLFQMALLLTEVDQTTRSDVFMTAFLERHNKPKAYRYAAETLALTGEYKRGLHIAKRAAQQGHILTKQAYPLMTRYVGDGVVEKALVYAIMRQESMFDVAARSPVGAMGLMQLMPPTAKAMAKKEGVAYSKRALTTDPAYNIRLGRAYLEELLRRFDGNYPMAIAAYNAGPSRVYSWLRQFGDPRAGDIALIDWIELIPIYETRNYVQRVLEGVAVYREVL